MVDFERLGALFGPGAPDPDLARFRIRSTIHETLMFISGLEPKKV